MVEVIEPCRLEAVEIQIHENWSTVQGSRTAVAQHGIQMQEREAASMQPFGGEKGWSTWRRPVW